MKKLIIVSGLVSSMMLLSNCTVNSSDAVEYNSDYNTGYYNNYTIGYEGMGGYGTYGSYTPAYWGSSFGYYPWYRSNYGAGYGGRNYYVGGSRAGFARTGFGGGHWGRR